jgi:hypothetical protein
VIDRVDEVDAEPRALYDAAEVDLVPLGPRLRIAAAKEWDRPFRVEAGVRNISGEGSQLP